ncbi:nitrile hydratase accessory protein [Methylobacterium sp. NEAU 140]|uniref:nitrile hydratase accessory protein n=1 Tax=Methylobacterium sp. NEAU 140 TaxID=3064945 RepID=UPI00273588BC|nr:nitrile hydratase accessory protein [Methylobacterium sp. NEAU 140]MDP4023320.1 nitrile hydratase accessory protein [Methylobacterium sp. NEAU 140]
MTGPEPEKNFAAPWEAQVFALVVSLQDSGLFTWGEWAERLGAAIRPAGSAERPADYGHWLATLEGILAERAVADGASVAARTEAWLRASRATPHGEPIRLENDPHYRA